jgi:hypothetical protein
MRELIERDSTTDPREHSERVGAIVLGFLPCQVRMDGLAGIIWEV